jgi:hypothetical protein
MSENENDRLRQALKDMLRLLEAAENCPLCCGPNVCFDSCHVKQWKGLRARIHGLLKQGANKPN